MIYMIHYCQQTFKNFIENFQNVYLEIYYFDPARFLTAPDLAWQAALKNTEVKLNHLTDISMLLMVKKKRHQRRPMSFYLSLYKS